MLNVNRWQKAVRLHPKTYCPTLSSRPGTAYHCPISPSSWADSWHQPWPSYHRMPPLSQWKRSQGWNRRCGSSARLSAFCPARWAPGKREKQDDYELRWKNTEQESSTVMGDFNTALSVIDRLRRQRVKNLKSTINKLHSCEHRELHVLLDSAPPEQTWSRCWNWSHSLKESISHRLSSLPAIQWS